MVYVQTRAVKHINMCVRVENDFLLWNIRRGKFENYDVPV